VSSKAWDFVDRFYDIAAWVPKNIVVVNTRAFRRLDDGVQNAILTAAAAAEKRGWAASAMETDAKIATLRENGMAVAPPSDTLVADLRKIGGEMLSALESSATPEAQAALASYRD